MGNGRPQVAPTDFRQNIRLYCRAGACSCRLNRSYGVDALYFSKQKPPAKSSSPISSGIGEVPRTLRAWVADMMKFKALMKRAKRVKRRAFLSFCNFFFKQEKVERIFCQLFFQIKKSSYKTKKFIKNKRHIFSLN